MASVFLLYAFLLGTVIGSFLNVVIYRLHTGRSLEGRSHCMSCGETLRWYELLPIVSYLSLRARCRTCGAYIPLRYLTVEILTGLSFLGLYLAIGNNPLPLILYGALASVLIVITVYDLRHTIIPDELTLTTLVLAILIAFAEGRPFIVGVHDVLAGLGAGLFFYLLWKVSEGRWIGLGDAKLAVPLGIIAGYASLSMVVLSFWVGAGVSLLLLGIVKLLKKGTTTFHIPLPRLTMKSEVPFAPFLIVGFLLAHFFHADIFAITAYLLPWSA